MSVNLIFKIAAIRIIVTVLTQILKHSGREEQAFFDKSCRTAAGIVLDRTIYLRIVFNDEGIVCIIGEVWIF